MKEKLVIEYSKDGKLVETEKLSVKNRLEATKKVSKRIDEGYHVDVWDEVAYKHRDSAWAR